MIKVENYPNAYKEVYEILIKYQNCHIEPTLCSIKPYTPFTVTVWFGFVPEWIYFKNVIVLNQIPPSFQIALPIAFSFPVAVFVKQEDFCRSVNEPLHSASGLTPFFLFYHFFASNLLGGMKGVCCCRLLFCFILVLFILIHYICSELFDKWKLASFISVV